MNEGGPLAVFLAQQVINETEGTITNLTSPGGSIRSVTIGFHMGKKETWRIYSVETPRGEEMG